MPTFGLPGAAPLDYTGIPISVIPLIPFPRRPLPTDKKFRPGTMAILKKNPSTGTEGELWYLSYFDSSGDAVWESIGTATGAIDTITLPDATVITPVDNNVNFLEGGGMSITGSGDDITFAAAGFVSWSVITDATQALTEGNGYFANRAGGVAFTLPATAAVGDTFAVSALNADGWTIAQNAGQTIRIGNQASTTGVGGSVASTAIGDSLILVCSVADTDFQAVMAPQGNLTIS